MAGSVVCAWWVVSGVWWSSHTSQAYTAPQKGPNRLSTTQWQQLQGVLEWAEPTPELLGDAYLGKGWGRHFGISGGRDQKWGTYRTELVNLLGQ